MHPFSRTPYFLAVAFAVVVALWLTSAEAQGPRRARGLPAIAAPVPEPASAEAVLGLAVAKVCSNEASLRVARPADCALIYQAVRRHGNTAAEQLAWLTDHSSCVLGEEEPSEMRGNCAWTRQLTRSSRRPPAWENAATWADHVPRWAAMLVFVDRMIAGHTPRGGWPCEQDPDTWGGHMDVARAVRLGYTQVACRGTANTGWMYPRWDRETPRLMDTVTVLPEEPD